MNQFVEIFGNKLKGFWEEGSEIQEQLVAEVRQYAISNPQSFIQDLREVQFNSFRLYQLYWKPYQQTLITGDNFMLTH